MSNLRKSVFTDTNSIFTETRKKTCIRDCWVETVLYNITWHRNKDSCSQLTLVFLFRVGNKEWNMLLFSKHILFSLCKNLIRVFLTFFTIFIFLYYKCLVICLFHRSYTTRASQHLFSNPVYIWWLSDACIKHESRPCYFYSWIYLFFVYMLIHKCFCLYYLVVVFPISLGSRVKYIGSSHMYTFNCSFISLFNITLFRYYFFIW